MAGDRTDARRLAFSIVAFLNEQLHSGSLSDDVQESLEVATQCLETAFGISMQDTHLATPKSLVEIFHDGTASLPQQTATQAGENQGVELTTEQRENAEELKNRGNQQMKNEAFDKAVECYSKAIAIDRRNAVYYCNRAAAYNRLSNFPAAVSDCEQAIHLDSHYSKAYGRMGLAFSSLGRHSEAADCFRKAYGLESGNETYRMNMEQEEAKAQEGNSVAGPPGFNLSGFLNNPGFMAMATSMMQSPQLQQMLSGVASGGVGGGGGGGGVGGIADGAGGAGGGIPDMSGLLHVGQQFAQQMQQQNPEIIEQLRSQMQGRPPSGNVQNDSEKPPPQS
uniref:small glutamine-rich tetratricopeptide repeat-containing protein alpha-like isoform X2 n=1 Tax=Myxine glutinosa TaxID=7769 RepID=UPI00358FC1E7